jgi:hypothetical protein
VIDAYQGKLGGPLADLAGLVGETLGIEPALITHEVKDGAGTLRVGDFITSRDVAVPRPRRAGDHAARFALFTVPGSPAWVSKASTHTVKLPQYDMEWSFEGRNAIQSEYRITYSEER